MGFEPMNTGFADQRVSHFAIGARGTPLTPNRSLNSTLKPSTPGPACPAKSPPPKTKKPTWLGLGGFLGLQSLARSGLLQSVHSHAAQARVHPQQQQRVAFGVCVVVCLIIIGFVIDASQQLC